MSELINKISSSNSFWRYISVLIVLIISLPFCTVTFSQNRQHYTEQFSISDGLSNSHITVLFQDSKGYLWIGTSDGLNRYDGYGFEVFRHNPLDSSSIVGNYIQAITETPDGNIWIGTRNSGIAVWEKATGTFNNIGKNSKFFSELGESGVFGMNSIDSDVWVKTRNTVGKINTDLKDFEKFEHYSSFLKSGNSDCYPIVTYGNQIWFGSKDGIQCYNTDEDILKRIIPSVDEYKVEVNSLAFIDDSFLIAGSNKGLMKYHLNGDYFEPVCKEKNDREPLPVNAILVDNKNILAGTSKGLMVIQPPYESCSVYQLGDKSAVSFDNITSILVDNSNLLWIGTKQDGLFKIDRRPPKFASIVNNESGEYSFECYDFQSVYVDNKGWLWLGTSNKGIYRLNRETQKLYHYPVKNNSEVNAIYEDSKGNMWFGTNNGIFILKLNGKRIIEFDYSGSDDLTNLLRSNPVVDIIEGKSGDIWFATQFGLYRFDGDKINSYWADTTNDKSLCHDEINVLFEDSDSLIWIGTNGGVNVYNYSDKSFSRISNIEGEKKILSHNIITSFAENDDTIVIGTNSGLSYYDKKTKQGGFWDNDDLISTKVYSLEVDDNNSIWISTGAGILSIKPGESPFHYNKNDGVPDYNFNVNASYHHDKNELFFGGDKGLTIINTDSVRHNKNRPKVVISDVAIYYKGKKQQYYKGDLKEIDIKYKRNSMIRVSFSALEFTYPLSNYYRIYLEGHDDDWREVTTDNYVNFSNLSPGTYTLNVTGANNDFYWNEEPTRLIIKVAPPLWMSGYAYAFYIIFGILLLQTFINYRIRNYRKAYKALTEKAVDKKKIEEQKESLALINQSLTDSISYAKRIQEAMIPSEEMVRNILPESFIYYRPKDIVSGDFYWTYQNNGNIFLAAVDCTGHGVPGAFMSIIGYDLLKNIVEVQGEKYPARILDRLSHEVALTFKQNGQDTITDEQSVPDGMDIALIKYDEEKQVLHFAGAMNSIYIIRDNEIITYKGDRFPIGYYEENNKLKYTEQEITMYPNDVVYLFSDGFADQFGGPEGKKFKYRRFRHLLLNIHKLPIEDQKAILHQKIEEWMGKEYEQVDDILLMGFKI